MLARLHRAGVFFTAVHERCRSVCRCSSLRDAPVKRPFRGFESRRAQKRTPVVWFCPSGRKGRHIGVLPRVLTIFPNLRYLSARKEELCFSFGAMQARALPVRGYRALPIGAKDALPHRAGGTEAISRRSRMGDNETNLQPLRRNTYNEKSDHQ